MHIVLKVPIAGVCVAGEKLDVNELWAEMLIRAGYAEPAPAEPTVTIYEDGHRTVEVRVVDALALDDH